MSDIKDDSIAPIQKSFFVNDHHAFVVKKAERLASALHVVTGFIAPGEPLRTRLRDSSLDLVQYASRVELISREGPTAFSSRCAEVSALLDIAQAAGMVSEMNVRLIRSEYAELARFMRERFSFISVHVPDVSATQPVLEPIKDRMTYRTPKRTISTNGHSNGQRQKDILALFDTKERITVKDATSAIPGVSEKTIQRELLAMVENRTLIKEGERRWSTYRKAT
ncbi:MAG: hypothetical protein AAB955_00690 [Patescibacteria group bacterium]